MKIFLANPRGFCAGVERAVTVVNNVMLKYPDKDIFVFHEIVHNKRVLDDFIKRGVKFIEDINEVSRDAVLIFSAHGVSQEVEDLSKNRGVIVIDATCPLVKKVHNEAMFHEANGRKIIVIGNKNHPEIIGTIGRLKNDFYFIEKIEDIELLQATQDEDLSYITQTTLSVTYTRKIVDRLKEIYPKIKGTPLKDICYATQNRQDAVREMAIQVDLILIIGSDNSSNSRNLRKTAIEVGTTSYLIEDYTQINSNWLHDIEKVGVSSGASAPDVLINDLITFFRERFNDIEIVDFTFKEERVKFRLPAI